MTSTILSQLTGEIKINFGALFNAAPLTGGRKNANTFWEKQTSF